MTVDILQQSICRYSKHRQGRHDIGISHTSSACSLNCNMKLKRLKCINESCLRPRSGLSVKMPWVWYFKTLNLSRFSTSTIFLTTWSPEQNITRIWIKPRWTVDKSSFFAKKLQKKFKLVLSYKTMFLKIVGWKCDVVYSQDLICFSLSTFSNILRYPFNKWPIKRSRQSYPPVWYLLNLPYFYPSLVSSFSFLLTENSIST